MGYAYEKAISNEWRLMLVDDADLAGEIRSAADFSRYDSPVVAARVPGDWPLDYVRAGLLEDPYFGDNYLKLRDYENSHVFYAVRFEFDGAPDENTFLKFEGIDTVADVYLNGAMIGHAENMYIPHEFRAVGLKKGENELLVHILPAVLEARKYPIAAQNSILKYNYESLVIRKATHMFGWDICPRIVSAGLWREVKVVQKKVERIEDVFLWVDGIADGKAVCVATFDVEIGRRPVKPYEVRLEGVCGKSRFSVSQKLWYIHGRMKFEIENPALWWPRGYGEANQYAITATLLKDGEIVDAISFRQGLRTVELKYDQYIAGDAEAEFCFIINGRRVYVKGTNWVPADAFHSNDAARIPKILELVKDVGCNAMRVWGGGVYESDEFYDWCDANGIMIWQDFMMACGVYPHTERMKDQLREEATVQVRRLRRHASICLWAGDNECDCSYYFNAAGRLDPSENVLTREVIAGVLRAEDLSRPYLPSSPYISKESFAAGHAMETPEQHLWGPRDYFKGHFYHDHNATFASEMGYHGCNSPESIRRFIPEDALWPETDNGMWKYHCASPETEDSPYTYRIPLMSGQIRNVFDRAPENLEEYARMSQICQAEAKKYFVESFRSHKGVRTGLIWWNIMDCWPQFSDAVVDYYFVKKLAYFFIRRSQQPLCLMMDDKSGELTLYAVNDYQTGRKLSFRVTDVDTGRMIAGGEANVGADIAVPLEIIRDDGGIHFYAIDWETENGEKGSNHYLQGKPKYDFEWYMKCLKKLGLDEFEGF